MRLIEPFEDVSFRYTGICTYYIHKDELYWRNVFDMSDEPFEIVYAGLKLDGPKFIGDR